MPRLLFIGLLLSGLCRAEPELNYFTVNGAGGVPLSVVTAGSPEQQAIVFIHGLGQSHYSFHKQLESDLAEDFYLVAFDLRGHGGSGKPWDISAYNESSTWAADVAAVMAATKAERPLIVAWSYGTLVALDYVRQFGISELAGMVFTGSLGALRPFVPGDTDAEDDPNMAEFVRLRELQSSPDLRDQVAASEWVVGWLTSEPVAQDEQVVLQSVAMMLPAYARRGLLARAFNNEDLFPALTDLPVFLALGEDDNTAMLENAALIAATKPNYSLSIYVGAGHSVFYEQPARFNAELRNFIERVQSP